MPFLKIENAINICKSYLDSIDENTPNLDEIKIYIVAGLILLIVSEYEELIENIFSARAELCGDIYVSSYVKKAISQKFRSPDLGKITETLGRFGSDYKKIFSDKILDSDAHGAWDNIMQARHAIVHKKGNLNITFHELLLTYPKTILVIDELRTVLGII